MARPIAAAAARARSPLGRASRRTTINTPSVNTTTPGRSFGLFCACAISLGWSASAVAAMTASDALAVISVTSSPVSSRADEVSARLKTRSPIGAGLAGNHGPIAFAVAARSVSSTSW